MPSEMLHLLLTPNRGGAGPPFLALQTRLVAVFKAEEVCCVRCGADLDGTPARAPRKPRKRPPTP